MNEQNISIVNNLKAAIEAILFAAGYPVKYTRIAEVLGIEVKDVKALTAHLAEIYADDENGCGLMLLNYEENGTCQLCTKEQYAPYIREALGIRKGGNLSASSLEVLAIVAYNQPVTRSFIDTVRGTDSSYATTSLIDKGLIEACGRLDAPGRPILFRTTEKFLRVFGLNSLEELPVAEHLIVPENNDVSVESNNKKDISTENGGALTEIIESSSAENNSESEA